MNNNLVHLNDGEGRPVCNSYMPGPYDLASWLEDGKINCAACNQLILMASTKLFQMQGLACDISNLHQKISANFDKLGAEGIADLGKLKRKLEIEERKFHPRSVNEAYVMSLLMVSEQEFNKRKNERVLNRG